MGSGIPCSQSRTSRLQNSRCCIVNISFGGQRMNRCWMVTHGLIRMVTNRYLSPKSFSHRHFKKPLSLFLAFGPVAGEPGPAPACLAIASSWRMFCSIVWSILCFWRSSSFFSFCALVRTPAGSPSTLLVPWLGSRPSMSVSQDGSWLEQQRR